MANKTNFTQVSALVFALSILNGEKDIADVPAAEMAEVTDKLSAMVATLEKKRTTVSKADREKAVAVENILSTIVSALATLDKPSTISEIQATNAELATFSNQRMSAMLKKLVDNGKVEKIIEKKKAYFRLVETVTE